MTAHFHMIFGGSVVIMYFAIAYDLWPKLTQRAAPSLGLQRVQLWTWAAGLMVLSLPWHLVGMAGQWRRVVQFDYSDPTIAWWAPWMTASLIGGVILAGSSMLFIWNLAAFHLGAKASKPELAPFRYAAPLHVGAAAPAALNGLTLWNMLVLVLMTAAYAFPLAHTFILKTPHAVVHRVDVSN